MGATHFKRLAIVDVDSTNLPYYEIPCLGLNSVCLVVFMVGKVHLHIIHLKHILLFV